MDASSEDRRHRIVRNRFSWASGYADAIKRRKLWQIAAYVGWIAICVLVMIMASSCATCKPVCCAECPKEIQIIEAAPEIIIVPAPLPPIPEIPPMQCVEQWELVGTNPLGWAQLAIEDMLTARRILFQVVGDLEALEATRPIAPDP